MDVANALQATHAQVTLCYLECCVLSILDFEAVGGSVVCYCFSNYLLRGHSVAVNMTWGCSSRLNAETLETALTQISKVLHPYILFSKTTVDALNTPIFSYVPQAS